MKKIFALLILLHTLTYLCAQEQLSKKELADRLFEREEYFKSLNLYLDVANRNNPDIRMIERVADCYRLLNDSRNAEQWYANAISYTKAEYIDVYYYAEALQRNQKLPEAKAQYRAYYQLIRDPETLRFKLASCDSAAKWIAAPQKSYTVNSEKKLNTTYSEWGTNFYGEQGLVFTSDRILEYDTKSKQTDNRTGNNYFKLYYSNKDSLAVLPVSKQNRKLFNGDYHIGPAVFNQTADTAWITVTTTQPRKLLPVDKRGNASRQRLYTRRLMLVMATKTNGVWGGFKEFAYNNIKEYSVGHAALSYGGDVLYFSSDMPGGEGKTDIWYCLKQADGSWGKPVNCGKTINTKEEEAFPVTQGPGVLIYASKGLPGMGGFDIYTATGKEAAWSFPNNHKYPVNSTADDFYFLTGDGLSGYFSSNREGGAGNDDVYSFTYQPAPKVQPSAPLVSIPTKPAFKPEDLHAIVYYDLDKANIRTDAAIELDKLVLTLKENPGLKIRLSSYTDVRASKEYNIALSKRRSDAVLNYLVNKGIAAVRFSANWFGKQSPVNNCADHINCTEAEHQMNRRTEITAVINK